MGAITDILEDLGATYRDARLEWHAEQASVAIAWLHVATEAFDGFTHVAEQLGSDHWQPIVALAEHALASGRCELAAAVFDAADQPGWHRDHLRRRRTQLLDEPTGTHGLRLVEDD